MKSTRTQTPPHPAVFLTPDAALRRELQIIGPVCRPWAWLTGFAGRFAEVMVLLHNPQMGVA